MLQTAESINLLKIKATCLKQYTFIFPLSQIKIHQTGKEFMG